MKFLALLAISAIAASAQVVNPERAIRKVTDRVYVATGYALGNVIYVITDKNLVVVDTTESPRAAKATLDDFHRTTNTANLPVSYIVYKHFHGDHSNAPKCSRRQRPRSVPSAKLAIDPRDPGERGYIPPRFI